MPAAAPNSPTRLSRRRAVVCATLLVVVAGGALGINRFFSPPWRVRVHVTGIPAGTDFASVAAESGGAVVSMDLSPANELSIPFTMHPAGCVWSYQRPQNPRVEWDAYVRWQPGERFGVVTRATDGTWGVHWFEAGAVPLRGWRVLGRGEASFDLTKARAVLLPAAQVKELGFDKVVGWD